MLICPSCGHENRDGSKFCEECGTRLEPTPSLQAEERKTVTVLFCDLVGFTAASETADPEDVRARLKPYHTMLRAEIERYGGTVEKFIGDAVMAVFGAPVAHEDDPERAVRAGLRILEAITELNEDDPTLALSVRIGINTGNVLVALGARPSEGEGIVTGDVVNTASRLQGAAPVNGVAVGEGTYLATMSENVRLVAGAAARQQNQGNPTGLKGPREASEIAPEQAFRLFSLVSRLPRFWFGSRTATEEGGR